MKLPVDCLLTLFVFFPRPESKTKISSPTEPTSPPLPSPQRGDPPPPSSTKKNKKNCENGDCYRGYGCGHGPDEGYSGMKEKEGVRGFEKKNEFLFQIKILSKNRNEVFLFF